jgi:hypothetical protein
MKSGQGVGKITTARCLGDLVSAVRTVTRAGASWAETVALGWRLAAEFDHANIYEGNEISESRLGSQQRQTQGDVRTLAAVGRLELEPRTGGL